MLQIRQEQQATLSAYCQGRFLSRLSTHLGDMHRHLYPAQERDYQAPKRIDRVRKEMHFLLNNDITKERDVVTAIEYFELFNVDPDSEPVVQAITDWSKTAAQKLELLWDLRRK